MPKKLKSPDAPTELRTRAERQMNTRLTGGAASPPYDPQRLVQELEVHQIELEMQNAELRSARDEAAVLLEKYTCLYDFAPVGYFTLAPDGSILLANLNGSTLVETERYRLIGWPFAQLVSLDYRPAFDQFLKQAFESPHRQSIDSLLLQHANPPKPVNIEVQRSPDGTECRAVVVDITDRKLAEEVLLRNQGLFSSLIEQAPVGVYLVDAAFQLQQANPTAMMVFRDVRPLIGRDFSEIIHMIWPKRVADQITARFRHTLKTGEPYQSPDFAEKRRDSGAEEVYEWQLQRVTLPSGAYGVVCFFTDITERRRAEEARRELDFMIAANFVLKEEITRREAVEEALLHTKREQARLLIQSEQQQAQLRGISHQILRAQEEERKRISRELHDVITQTLVGINVNVVGLAQCELSEPGSLCEKIATTQRLVEHAVEIVHEFARQLRPSLLDDLGLIPALHSYLKAFMTETGIRASLKCYAGVEKASSAVRTVLFRVAQESLTNVARHAGATQVSVSIEKTKGAICMEIADDGQGFEVDGANCATPNNRLGLIGMRERVEMIGGSFCVDSAPGQPTTIHVEIKLTQPGTRKPRPKRSPAAEPLECP